MYREMQPVPALQVPQSWGPGHLETSGVKNKGAVDALSCSKDVLGLVLKHACISNQNGDLSF